jgi:hypothetical protein
MSIALVLLIVAGVVPIARAILANRRSSLLDSLIVCLFAWLAWGAAFLLDEVLGQPAFAQDGGVPPLHYSALSLTGCTAIAVLGARRPGVFAWNLVVLALFCVMMWPLFETHLLGTRTFDGLRIVFIAGTLAVGVINFVPTRLAPAALVFFLAGAGKLIELFAPSWLPRTVPIWDLLLTAIPWIAWSCLAKNAGATAFDRLWLDFRDSWGLFWAQRVREQFNHAAENAGIPVRLSWLGLRRDRDAPALTPEENEKLLAILQGVLQRFW